MSGLWVWLVAGVVGWKCTHSTRCRVGIAAENETKSLEKNAKKLQTDIESNVGVQNQLQNQIFTLQQEMDGMQQQMQWDEEQLAEWLENARLREEDAEVIRKYEQADETRVKELTLELQRLNTAVLKAERHLESEVTNTRSHRLGLDKVSRLFKGAHKERTDLIAQWEGTVGRMENEDAEIEAAAARFQALKAESTVAKVAVAEQQEFLEDQEAANKVALSTLERHERGVVTLEGARESAAAQVICWRLAAMCPPNFPLSTKFAHTTFVAHVSITSTMCRPIGSRLN